MTNLEKLRNTCLYPVKRSVLVSHLENRALSSVATYDNTVDKQAMDLAYADLLLHLIVSPNISEGGFSIGAPQIAEMKNIANGIFGQYGLTPPAYTTGGIIRVKRVM